MIHTADSSPCGCGTLVLMLWLHRLSAFAAAAPTLVFYELDDTDSARRPHNLKLN